MSLPDFDPKLFDDYEFDPHKSGTLVRLRRLDSSYLFWLCVTFEKERRWTAVKPGEKILYSKVVDYDELDLTLWNEGRQK